MFEGWIETCCLAYNFHIEEHGKELWLVQHKTELIDGYVEFPISSGKLTNIPFRPQVLVCKADKKEAPKTFPWYAEISLWYCICGGAFKKKTGHE